MDILIQENKAHELFPNGAPELHPSLEIVKDYTGAVEQGWDWDGAEFTAPSEPILTAEDVRLYRDQLLKETDWWASTDLVMTQEQIDYRQALRDITTQAGFPEDVNWPSKP